MPEAVGSSALDLLCLVPCVPKGIWMNRLITMCEIYFKMTCRQMLFLSCLNTCLLSLSKSGEPS